MLTVHNLTRSYGDVRALDGVSFSVQTGSILGFLGPNGAGKSTAMKIICGFLAADDGHVHLDNEEIHEHATALRARIGVLPEHAPLYNDMEVRDYLVFCGAARGLRRDMLARRLDAVVAQTALASMLLRPIHTLSRGYRQRVGLAQALIHEPKLLILDEPTSGMDPAQTRDIHVLLRELARSGVTVIFSTHVLSEVEAIADSLLIINRGRVLASGTKPEVLSKACGARKLVVESARFSDDFRAALRALSFVQATQTAAASRSGEGLRLALTSDAPADASARVFSLAAKSSITLTALVEEGGTLNDAFLELIRTDDAGKGVQR